jgi:hypothetical protein
MKSAKSLNELVQELDRRNGARQDYIANTTNISMHSDMDSSRIMMGVKGHGMVEASMKSLAMDQVMQRLEIPAAHYRKNMSKDPVLLDFTVNHMLKRDSAPMMVRTLDGAADAVLSNAYKRIDNYPVAEMVIPVLHEAGVEVQSCEVTDRKMYIKCVSPRLQGDVKVGDPVQMGIVVSNSEVGLGFLNVQALIYRLICDNGMISGRDMGDGIRMAHRGSRQDYGIVYAEDTLRTHGRAISMQVRDTVQQMLHPDNFQKHLEAIKEITEHKVTGDPTKAVEQLGKVVGFTQNEGTSIMRHLIEGGDLSQYGLLNAVTRFAQDDEVSYDRSTELEIIGGKILELRPNQWRSISEAA